ncbi:LCP family protein [Waterburya agarophytonicola K14]|uniref:LCP family protein n=1 Tax=Waterburya agarophytonicola KI4 TaxID=2874699 RepID=A0A964BM93_9CYAN|nr:LCP family protein [Waterburya agarophytonicola]MCC0176059.1 LCP family protein [Waterburya agarophytonicola KI4]
MNQERSHGREKASANWENEITFFHEDTQKLESIPMVDRHPVKHQINLLEEDFERDSKQSYWFYFTRGLFWGVIVGFTAILSASCGVALTKIDRVEKIIVRTIDRNSISTQATTSKSLTRPVNILVLEVKPSSSQITKLSPELVGDSKTILLLQFEPQSNITRIINIPTNSRVKIPDFGWGTIADANRYGGTTLVSQMVVQLMDGLTIDRYIRATPDIFQKLIASGKITLDNCNDNLRNCADLDEQILRQETAAETIRQRLNIPGYLRSFKTTLNQTKAGLDTNLSLAEAMSIANFVKELESDGITVNLVSGYEAGKTININDRLAKSQLTGDQAKLIKPLSTQDNNYLSNNKSSLQHHPIAIQNTTDSPELGMRFVTYLRRQSFQDVYLVEHIPLKLDKTRIIINQSQLSRAKHLQNIIGLGSLEPKPDAKQQPITIQIGEDAHYLPLDNRNY